ncbi:tRNA1(Val) (adenine(37)-N6)-methyltransferase [Carnobacteriaceae bacterium zg-ZUI78]|nr:tRNA1(Val) (adenine(37)-N6)-methyltransferase [Carnobacteriaceae bacterium zg-ZUI78]
MKLYEHERLDTLIKENIQIIQSKKVFSFSLDAVLLAHFAELPRNKKACILDACSGNGAVAFMISAKTNNPIYAIEYQEILADMAQRTVTLNHLEDRVKIIHGDYNDAQKWFDRGSVDVITCNPPYFTTEDYANIHEENAIALARHELTITLDEWVSTSSQLLKNGGKLYCVHRPDRLLQLLTALKSHQLVPKKMCFVHPKKEKDANMVLIEAVKQGKEKGIKIIPPIIVFNEKNEYIEPVRSILYGE